MLSCNSFFISPGRALKNCALVGISCLAVSLADATVLFEDNFGIIGWTAVQPQAAYVSGPLRWQLDSSGAISEQSNIHTDSSTVSATATAPMLINDTVTGELHFQRAHDRRR